MRAVITRPDNIQLIPENDADAVILEIFDGREVRISGTGGYRPSSIPNQRIWMNLEFREKGK